MKTFEERAREMVDSVDYFVPDKSAHINGLPPPNDFAFVKKSDAVSLVTQALQEVHNEREEADIEEIYKQSKDAGCEWFGTYNLEGHLPSPIMAFRQGAVWAMKARLALKEKV